jgi:hypothetical protein
MKADPAMRVKAHDERDKPNIGHRLKALAGWAFLGFLGVIGWHAALGVLQWWDEVEIYHPTTRAIGANHALVAAAPNRPETPPSPVAQADDVDVAVSLCDRVSTIPFVTECTLDAYTVNITVNMASDEAIKICPQATQSVNQKTPLLRQEGWKMQIFSPYGQRPIASCRF